MWGGRAFIQELAGSWGTISKLGEVVLWAQKDKPGVLGRRPNLGQRVPGQLTQWSSPGACLQPVPGLL